VRRKFIGLTNNGKNDLRKLKKVQVLSRDRYPWHESSGDGIYSQRENQSDWEQCPEY
jgi:hypothetical protein